jgi:O-antigen/teichoic acid export membrane protein
MVNDSSTFGAAMGVIGVAFVIGLAIQFFIARAIAKYAAKKGFDYNLFFWLSFLVSWLIMLIVALASSPKTPAAPNVSSDNI